MLSGRKSRPAELAAESEALLHELRPALDSADVSRL
jgi:hypothetical protein